MYGIICWVKDEKLKNQCEPCGNVALCVEPCFEIYHTKKDIKSNLYDDNDDSSSSSEYTSTMESESEEEVNP